MLLAFVAGVVVSGVWFAFFLVRFKPYRDGRADGIREAANYLIDRSLHTLFLAPPQEALLAMQRAQALDQAALELLDMAKVK